MNEHISSFLESKPLTENSRQAYRYDVQQFLEVCQNQISPSKLAIYQAFLQDAKIRVQQRKLSAVNQFLYFLYENGHLDRFYKLKTTSVKKNEHNSTPNKVEDLSILWQETDYPQGQLIALLVAHLGLTPSELAAIRQEHLNLQFQMLTLEKGKNKRIISLPKDLIPYLQAQAAGVYLFDKKGKAYSRQWFYNRLSEFVASIHHKTWTAQYLREQYILAQLASGQTVDDLAKQLGLTSRMSLEKYR